MHWIKFPNKKEHLRGLMSIFTVPRIESLGLPDLQMVVEDEHIRALERDKVRFKYVSKTKPNGKKKTPVRP